MRIRRREINELLMVCGILSVMTLFVPGCQNNELQTEPQKDGKTSSKQQSQNQIQSDSSLTQKSSNPKSASVTKMPTGTQDARPVTTSLTNQNAGKTKPTQDKDESPFVAAPFNPYHTARKWKVWLIDDPALAKKVDDLNLTDRAKRVYPNPTNGFEFSRHDSMFAGAWDDVYVSQDNFHSKISAYWQDNQKKRYSLAGQIPVLKRSHLNFELGSLGTAFSSQSTTGMGHDIANRSARVARTERDYYFQNILRAGPAHISFRDLSHAASDDKYEALIPCMFNSVGSSGSETWGLTKLAIAGANMKTEIKTKIKERGLYAATLLYLWKAGLPLAVPYEHEFRHRVAYFSDGNDRIDRGKKQSDLRADVFKYDDELHLENMVKMARAMDVIPPVSIVNVQSVEGGELVYDHKTAVLVRQKEKPVRMVVSTKGSYDIQGRALTCRLSLINGTPETKIKQLNQTDFEIMVPSDLTLPKGRTSILVVADNGVHKSNPAVINVYRSLGKVNQRPTIQSPRFVEALPGESVKIDLTATDPENHSLKLTARGVGKGVLKGDQYLWDCPSNQQSGNYPIYFYASDNLSGSSVAVAKTMVRVRNVIPQIDVSEVKPYEYRLDASASRAAQNESLQFQWKVNGRDLGNGPNKNHRFESAGYHSVQLVAKTDSDAVTVTKVIHCEHDWKSTFRDGWTLGKVGPDWKSIDDSTMLKVATRDGKPCLQVVVKKRSHDRKGVSLDRPFSIPCFVEVEFVRGHNVPGACLEFFGGAFGRANVSTTSKLKFSDDLSYSQLQKSTNQFEVRRIGTQPKLPSQPSRLSFYVTRDNETKGDPKRIRFSGYFESDSGKHFFDIRDQSKTTDRFAVISGEMGVQIINKFEVWEQ